MTGSALVRTALAAAALVLAPCAVARAGPAVSVDARLERSTVAPGEPALMKVTVEGTMTGVRDPEVPVPHGIELRGGGRSTSFSWVNGRGAAQTSFAYELVAEEPGRYTVGPIRVRVGDVTYACPTFVLTVAEGPASASPGNAAATSEDRVGSLVTSVAPASPYVGEPVLLRVRLIQRMQLAEDPRYEPPATPGFWTERASEPESYFGSSGGTRVLMTETRTRLYPLAAGVQSIGPARAQVAVEGPGGSSDPFAGMGSDSRRRFTIESGSLGVRVRPLPAGAPAGFGGAVGTLTTAWGADRSQTAADSPIVVWFEVRGTGNLPLLKTPVFPPADYEVFAATLDDSFASPGTLEPGRRSFRWTVLPRHPGPLTLAPPVFSWFDPAAGVYRSPSLAPIRIAVGPPADHRAPREEGLPGVFVDHPLDPFARAANPWGALAAGALTGLAIATLRGHRRRAVGAGTLAREHARGVAGAPAATLFGAVEEACAWLAQQGRPQAELEREIAAARFGRERVNPEVVRARVLRELRAAGHERGSWGRPVIAGVALVLAGVAAVWSAPRPGPQDARVQALTADAAARTGDAASAIRGYRLLWQQGARGPALAARLAWSELGSGEVARASLWTMRGMRERAPDPALAWVRERVAEAGGLAGGPGRTLPLGLLEWSIAAFGFAALAGAFARRPPLAIAALVLALASTLAMPFARWNMDRSRPAVVMRRVMLEGGDAELEPGRVVSAGARAHGNLRIVAGRGIEGWVAADAVREVSSLP